MKTKEELQLAVDAIRKVRNEHGVILVGSCESEGITGEIALYDARYPSDVVLPEMIRGLADWGANIVRVSSLGTGLLEVFAIGDVVKEVPA